MTDSITCPECDVRRGMQLGRLFLACRFCQGRGWVGAEHEPGPPPERPPAWEHAVWSDPAVASAMPCRYSMGTQSVAHVDEESRSLAIMACPGCVPT
ncbi:hypothetical protein [Nonomuraea cavernae]|uniref:hypothetical protein n=1 Tax=Nonomuraea cavernae TaxID=2045107 RepID=UPI0033D35006